MGRRDCFVVFVLILSGIRLPASPRRQSKSSKKSKSYGCWLSSDVPDCFLTAAKVTINPFPANILQQKSTFRWKFFHLPAPPPASFPAGGRPPYFEGDTSGPEEKITGPEVFPSGPEVFPIAAEVSRPAAYCRGNGPFRQPAVGFFWKNVPFLFCLSACLA